MRRIDDELVLRDGSSLGLSPCLLAEPLRHVSLSANTGSVLSLVCGCVRALVRRRVRFLVFRRLRVHCCWVLTTTRVSWVLVCDVKVVTCCVRAIGRGAWMHSCLTKAEVAVSSQLTLVGPMTAKTIVRAVCLW